MANTFELISSTTIGVGGASSYTFTAIPSSYTDLVLKMSTRENTTGIRNLEVWFNSNTTSYSGKVVYGTGSATGSDTITTQRIGINEPSNFTSSTFNNFEIYIPNYAGSNNKAYVSDSVNENNATLAYAVINAAYWSNTAAITSISIAPQSGASFVENSTFYLYGVKSS